MQSLSPFRGEMRDGAKEMLYSAIVMEIGLKIYLQRLNFSPKTEFPVWQ